MQGDVEMVSLSISVSDLVSCRKYVETIPEYAKKKGEEIHKMVEDILMKKYDGEPEVELSYRFDFYDDMKSLELKGRIDFIDHGNKRLIEIKPMHMQYYGELQLWIYYELADLNYYHDYEPWLLLYRVRNGKLHMHLQPMRHMRKYNWTIQHNLKLIWEIAERINNGEYPKIRVMSCPKCPYRLECEPDYVWIKVRQGKHNNYVWMLTRYDTFSIIKNVF